MRQFGDLDLLIDSSNLADAYHLLMGQGYDPDFDLREGFETAVRHAAREIPFHHPDTGVAVELQWRLLPKYFSISLETEALSSRLQPVSLSGTLVRSLSPEDLLLVLCVHGAKHLWERISWIRDVAQIISSSSGLDWDYIFECAHVAGMVRIMLLGLALAERVTGARLPASVSQRVQADRAIPLLIAKVWKHLPMWGERVPGMISDPVFHLRARERWRDRLRYGVGYVFAPTPSDVVMLRMPGLLPFTFMFRPFRLAHKYGGIGLRKFRRDSSPTPDKPRL